MNKFDQINKVLISHLKPEDKALLIELIMRADSDGTSWPSVERLCKVRGIKHEKNFKGADYYLPGLVTKIKKGRRNVYMLNTPAIEGLSEADVVVRHTPSTEGNTPAVEGVNSPAVAGNTPAVEGANSSIDTTLDSTNNSTSHVEVADAPSTTDEVLEVREAGTVSTNTEDTQNDGYVYKGFLNLEDFAEVTWNEQQFILNHKGVTKMTEDAKPHTPPTLAELDQMRRERLAAIAAEAATLGEW